MRDIIGVRCPDCDEFVIVPGEEQLNVPLFVATCHNCESQFDWRGVDAEYLRGATLAWQEYLAQGEGVWSYDCCSLCWQRFMEQPSPGVEQVGYITFVYDKPWWICQQCFDVFNEDMDWRVEPAE